jgi:hypothetical protein
MLLTGESKKTTLIAASCQTKTSPDRTCNPGCLFSLKPLGYAATASFTSSLKA